jgi:hypothetical protein
MYVMYVMHVLVCVHIFVDTYNPGAVAVTLR